MSAQRPVLLAALACLAGCLEAPPGPLPPLASDASLGSDAAANPECDEVFGTAPDYVLCGSDEASCTFYLRLLDGEDFTCAMACEEFGAECLDGLADTDQDDKCEVDVNEDCMSEHADQICVCALPLGLTGRPGG